MAQNYVEIKIKAADTAKPDLTELKLQLDELGRKVDTAKVDVDDDDASLKLLRLNAKLADINAKVANPRIKVAGAAKAEADLMALNLELDKLNAKSDELKLKADSSGPGGLIGRLFGGIGGGAAGDAAGGGGFLANPYLLGGLAAGIAALLPEVVAVTNGFVAAGAGAGAFYLLAHPAISNLTTDTQNLLAAQQKLQQAQNMYAVDPTKANAKALQTAQDNLKAVQMSMGQDAGGAAAGIAKLRTEYDKLTTAFQPDVFKVFNAGLKVMNNLLPIALPFAKTFADVMDGLLKRFADFTSPSGPVDELRRTAGDMLNFEQLLNPAGMKPGRGMLNWEQILNPAGMKAAAAQLNYEQLLNPAKLAPNPQQLTPFQQFIDQLHRLEGPALQAIGNGISQVTVAIAKLLTTFSGTDVANGINILFSVVAGAINAVRGAVDFLKWAWDKLSQNPTFKRIAGDIATAWDSISTTGKKKPDFSGLGAGLKDAVTTAYDWLYKTLAPLIDKALNAASKWLQKNAGPILVPVGKALISGLIQGIENSIPSLLPTLGNVAKFIAEHKGPIDVDRLLLVPHGQAIMAGLMDGMDSRLPALRSNLAGISRTISAMPAPAPAGGAAGGGGGDIVFHLGAGGSGLEQQFWTWLKNGVRAQGGDPAMFTRKVKFL